MGSTAYVPDSFPRQWLPAEAELTTWEQIEPWYRRLLDQPIASSDELEQWLFAVGELNAAVGQVGTKRYVAMTCQTDDPEREAAYLEFVRDIEPRLKPLHNEIRTKYLDSPYRSALPSDRYHVFDRAPRRTGGRSTARRTFPVKRNSRAGSAVSEDRRRDDGQLPGENGRLRKWPRSSRKPTGKPVRPPGNWSPNRRLADRETLDDLFDQMVKLRVEVAREAGFPNYVEYAYRLRERFDYGINEAVAFQSAIERVVVPLARRIQEERKRAARDRVAPSVGRRG